MAQQTFSASTETACFLCLVHSSQYHSEEILKKPPKTTSKQHTTFCTFDFKQQLTQGIPTTSAVLCIPKWEKEQQGFMFWPILFFKLLFKTSQPYARHFKKLESYCHTLFSMTYHYKWKLLSIEHELALLFQKVRDDKLFAPKLILLKYPLDWNTAISTSHHHLVAQTNYKII